ncbi:spermidine synthase [Sulfobacillus acidophilus TPY]|uniref:Polyamine aminopropyltransferase n=1 Tax=Sulfobacillus acidophilus (strain ATCC 700253 / DSM 10332 / NAL) TaxID=679936 RepID=G8U1A8_SULAD|nr:spermidine synthase [Sulfobacillus acidophilus TPY]AEW05428.1 Spermidine synthase [Sulfobacillus acidophilus DSM 10332]
MALWFRESASPAHRLEWKIRQELYSGQSPFQSIQVLDTEQFGPSLVLDGIMQTTTGDEFIYHEMLAYVPLLAHPHPRRVLIIGGGDGGLAREVLKVPGVEEVVLVEIDPVVVEVARRFLPQHTVALDDPRLTLIHADGAAYLTDQKTEPFDVILVDSTDPEGDGPGTVLYTPAFHQALYEGLADDGLYVQQTGAAFYNPEVVEQVSHSVVTRFPLCRVYWCTVPTYPGALFTFTSGSKRYDIQKPSTPLTWPTRWYTPQIHQLAFALPPYLSQRLPETVVTAQKGPNA